MQNRWMPEDLIRTVSRIMGEDEKELCRRGKNSMDRAILMELLYRFCNVTRPGIGRLAGGIDYSAVSVVRKRLRVNMETDEPLRKRFEDMVDHLSRVKI